jgi:hypothetical protein
MTRTAHTSPNGLTNELADARAEGRCRVPPKDVACAPPRRRVRATSRAGTSRPATSRPATSRRAAPGAHHRCADERSRLADCSCQKPCAILPRRL